MTLNEYQMQAARTDTPKKNMMALLNGVLGLTGEAGECADIVKKAMFQGHELDREHLIEEAGDTLWYIGQVARALGVTLETIAQRNIDKLYKRYPHGFDAERSRNREE